MVTLKVINKSVTTSVGNTGCGWALALVARGTWPALSLFSALSLSTLHLQEENVTRKARRSRRSEQRSFLLVSCLHITYERLCVFHELYCLYVLNYHTLVSEVYFE